MAEQSSGVVVRFPRPAADGAGGEQGARLRRAMDMLRVALEAQRAAVADWRAALTDLHASVEALGRTLGICHDSLGALGQGVVALNAEARRLEAIAGSAAEVASAPRTAVPWLEGHTEVPPWQMRP